MRTNHSVLLLLVLLLTLVACRREDPTPASQPPASQPPVTRDASSPAGVTEPAAPLLSTPTASSTPTETSGQPEVVDNPAVEPEQAPPAVPDRALTPQGPWLLVPARNGLWIGNPDGSGLFRLMDHEIIDPQKSLSPDGRRLAYVSLMMPADFFGFELYIMQLPDGKITEHLASLAPDDRLDGIEPGDAAFEAREAIYYHSPPVWSPDGKQLAFMGAINGPTSDLYVHNFATGETTQLTDGPSQGYQPSWSPDGKWVVHTGAQDFGTGAGYVMGGIWAARADGANDEVRSLYPLKDTAHEAILGWISDDTLIVHSWDMHCGGKNLRSVSVETGEQKALWPYGFSEYRLARDPAGGTMMLQVTGDSECSGHQSAGAYLVRSAGDPPQRVADEGWPVWSPEASLFLVKLEGGGMKAFTPAGEEVPVSPDFPTWPVASPGGELWAGAGDFMGEATGLWLGPLAGPLRKITDENMRLPTWSPDGQTLLFFGGEGLMYAAYAPDFIPVLVSDQVSPLSDPFWAGQ